MTSRNAQNAVAARARAMFGKSLQYDDYQALLACRSVGEVTAYLKANTPYASVLAEVNGDTVHREYLERRLRQYLWNCYASLIRLDLSAGELISGYLIQREETAELMRLLREMNVDRAVEYIIALPSFFAHHTDMDLLAVNRAGNMRELVAALEHTAYHAPLLPFRDRENGTLPLEEMETALYALLARRLLRNIESASGEKRRQLTALCGVELDARNVSRILRLKKYFHASPGMIRSRLLPPGGVISPAARERILAAEPEEIPGLFYASPAGRHIPPAHRAHTVDLPERAVYFTARHYLHFSTYPTVVLLAFIAVMETELIDIVNIIEGIYYRLPPEEIRPLLILGLERG